MVDIAGLYIFVLWISSLWGGFLGGARGKYSSCQCRRLGFNYWAGKIPWCRKEQPTSVSLPGKSHEQRSLAGYSPRGPKESDMTERLSTHTHTHTQCPERFKIAQVYTVNTSKSGLEPLTIVPKSPHTHLQLQNLDWDQEIIYSINVHRVHARY